MSKLDPMHGKNFKNVKNSEDRKSILQYIQPDCVLIKVNKFTGKITVGNGLSVIMPWHDTSVIKTSSKTLDLIKQSCRCANGFDITVDPAITYSIVDAKKYTYGVQNAEEMLQIKSQDIIKRIVSITSYEELSQKQLDENMVLSEFDDIAKKCGIKLEGFSFKSVELPLSMRDDYEKTEVQKLENQRKLMELQTEQEILTKELQMQEKSKETELNIQVKKINKMIETLKQHGFTAEEIKTFVSNQTFLNEAKENSNAYVFLNANNQQINSVANGVATGNVISQNQNTVQSEKENSSRIK